MSIIKSVQDWLSGFDGMELRPISEIKTDRPEDSLSSYALAPSGNGKTTTDILGNRTYQNNYVFYAKEAAADEVDRRDNYDFLEALGEWIEEQGDNENFPALPFPYKVESVEVSNALLFDLYDNGDGLYQVQLQITLTKRRD